jgi:hypothetical protein
VPLQTFKEDETGGSSVPLPSVQGLAEDAGMFYTFELPRAPHGLTLKIRIALEGLSSLSLDNGGALDVYATPEQLGEELVTLTLLPRSRWQTLLNLETIHVSAVLSA